MTASFGLPGMLRRARRVADLSQRDLAAALGVSHAVIARAEAGSRDVSASVLAAAVELAGMRLALLDASGAEVVGMADDTVRDGAGRRFPAHLDTRLSDEDWWHGPERYSRPQPTYSFDRDRRRRDAGRSRTGTPDDHLVPKPGDSPAERRAARRDEAWRLRRAEWERRREAGELPPLQDPECSCPSGCDDGLASGRPHHTDDCACGCDVG